MSYVSFLKNIPEALSQPTGIAALASLGIHGAIAFILPLMPVESSKSTKQATATPKPVSLTELTPAEQSRLPQPSPGIQAQLPPLPGQIPLLPGQQPPIPQTLPNIQAGLPPSPPLGSTSSAFPPLPKAPNFNSPALPKSTPLNLSRRDLGFDPSFKYNTQPSVNISSLPRPNRITNRDLALGASRQIPRPNISELPEAPSNNLPVPPPPLSPDGTVPPNLNNVGTPSNQPITQAPVNPETYVAPVGTVPKAGEGTFAFAQQGVQPFPGQSSNSPINNIPGSTTAAASPTVPGAVNPPSGTGAYGSQIKDTITIAEAFTEFKKQYPDGQLNGAPIDLGLDKSKLDRPISVTVSLNAKNEADSPKLLGDAASLPSTTKIAINERLREYFKDNPAAANGKGKFFTFRIAPDGNISSQPKPDEKTPAQTSQKPQEAQQGNIQDSKDPQGTNKPFSGQQIPRNQPVEVPSVNTPTGVQPAGETSERIQGNQTTSPKLPNSKSPDLPEALRRVRPAPAPPAKPIQQPQVRQQAPERQTASNLVDKLRENKTQASSTISSSQSRVLQQLRKVREERENNNP